jgi:hypothetical protein
MVSCQAGWGYPCRRRPASLRSRKQAHGRPFGAHPRPIDGYALAVHALERRAQQRLGRTQRQPPACPREVSPERAPTKQKRASPKCR